jgi:hypothetical protein
MSKTTKTLKMFFVPAENGTGHFSNASQERYRLNLKKNFTRLNTM